MNVRGSYNSNNKVEHAQSHNTIINNSVIENTRTGDHSGNDSGIIIQHGLHSSNANANAPHLNQQQQQQQQQQNQLQLNNLQEMLQHQSSSFIPQNHPNNNNNNNNNNNHNNPPINRFDDNYYGGGGANNNNDGDTGIIRSDLSKTFKLLVEQAANNYRGQNQGASNSQNNSNYNQNNRNYGEGVNNNNNIQPNDLQQQQNGQILSYSFRDSNENDTSSASSQASERDNTEEPMIANNPTNSRYNGNYNNNNGYDNIQKPSYSSTSLNNGRRRSPGHRRTQCITDINIESWKQNYTNIDNNQQQRYDNDYNKIDDGDYYNDPPLSIKVLPRDSDDGMISDDLNVQFAPPRFPLAHHYLFREDGSIDLEILAQHFKREGPLSLDDAFYLIKSTTELYKKEPNLLRLRDPITVCGDIHGQFFDLLRLMEAGGDPADTQYLFLGDYVNRGGFNTECIFFLCAHKITYNDTFFQIRGNHECRHLSSFFNFKDECLYKYNLKLYDAIMRMFDNLPIAATINGQFLSCHGGLLPGFSTLHDIDDFDRFQEVPSEGHLLWADPVDDEKEIDEDDYDDPDSMVDVNETRKCLDVFGIDAVATFLEKNNLTAIIRAHKPQFDGYRMPMINKQTQIPRVITIFTAPNYCDGVANKGACLKFDDELLNIRQFVSSPHPYYLPNFMDVFTWSLPFVAEKVTDMLYSILSYENPANLDGVDLGDQKVVTQTNSKILKSKGGVLKGKVVAVTKLMRMYKVLKENQNNIVNLKQLSPNGQIPHGVLSGGSSSIEKVIASFNAAKAADAVHKALPNANPNNNPNAKKGKVVFFSKSMDTNSLSSKSIDCKWADQYLVKDATHPYTGDKLNGMIYYNQINDNNKII